MPITVPKSLQDGVRAMAGIPPGELAPLVTFLNGIQPAILSEQVVESLYDRNALEPLAPKEFQAIVKAVVGLHSGRLSANRSVTELTSDVLSSTFVTEELDNSQRIQLTATLPALLAIRPLSTSAKAMSIFFDSPAHFSTARILTDVRPVFDDNGSENIECALIMQTLKISYHGNESDDLFVSLDTHDVEMVQAILSRAQAKMRAVEATLSASGIVVLKAPKA